MSFNSDQLEIVMVHTVYKMFLLIILMSIDHVFLKDAHAHKRVCNYHKLYNKIELLGKRLF